MAKPGDMRRIEREIGRLKTSTEKYLRQDTRVTPEAVSDLTKAVYELCDHLLVLGRRLENIEDTNEEWTTRGWIPPTGTDPPPS
jgi:hypothetical protein